MPYDTFMLLLAAREAGAAGDEGAGKIATSFFVHEKRNTAISKEIPVSFIFNICSKLII